MQTCWELNELAFPIALRQNSKKQFTVIYGKQIKSDLNYSQAAKELGACIMHAVACTTGNIDNS